MKILDFFGRSEIIRWRDRHTLEAAKILNQFATDFLGTVKEDVAATPWKESLFSREKFLRDKVDGPLAEAVRPHIANIVDRANRDLGEIMTYSVVWNDMPAGDPASTGRGALALDAALAAAPIAGGVAAAASLPALAVTTTTSFFGLVTATSVSWPVILGGGMLAGAGVATGLVNLGRIKSKADARLTKFARERVISLLLHGTPEHPAVHERLASEFSRIASNARSLKAGQ